MKRVLISVFLIGILVFWGTCKFSMAEPITGISIINFNEISIGERFYKNININDVTFTSTSATSDIADTMRIWDYNNENPTNQLNWIEGQSMEIHYRANPIISFSEETDFIGFNISFIDGPWTLEVYDISDNLLESLIIPGSSTGTPTGWEFYGIQHSGISYAKLIGDGTDNVMIDNLHYRTTFNPVPEPATILLFGIGILGIAGVSRKKTA